MLGPNAYMQDLASPSDSAPSLSSHKNPNGAVRQEGSVTTSQDAKGELPRQVCPSDFCKLSSQHNLCLRGIAGASSESKRAIVFFSPEQDPHRDVPTSIPLDRIQTIKLLDKTPVENSPLHLPSLWKVAIELSPAPTEKFRIETTFESD